MSGDPRAAFLSDMVTMKTMKTKVRYLLSSKSSTVFHLKNPPVVQFLVFNSLSFFREAAVFITFTSTTGNQCKYEPKDHLQRLMRKKILISPELGHGLKQATCSALT